VDGWSKKIDPDIFAGCGFSPDGLLCSMLSVWSDDCDSRSRNRWLEVGRYFLFLHDNLGLGYGRGCLPKRYPTHMNLELIITAFLVGSALGWLINRAIKKFKQQRAGKCADKLKPKN
jgi:hypothetical protein